MADTNASGEELPHVSLDHSLYKTKEIVKAVGHLKELQDEADRKASKEARSHAATKEKIKAAESDTTKAREILENEMREHMLTKDKLEKAEREHNYSKEALLAQKQEVSSMVLQMEALKVEMEAQRKAFVVNVNWAAKCTELKVKYDESRTDYEKLNEQFVHTKSALGTASQVQEEYTTKSQSHVEMLEQMQEEIAKLKEELNSKLSLSDDIQAKLAEWEQFKQAQASESIKDSSGRSNAMAVLQRQLNEGAKGLLMSTYGGWSAYTKDEKKKRMDKDKSMKRALKLVANQGQALLAQSFKPWKADTERIRNAEMEAANRRLKAAAEGAGTAAEVARKRALEQVQKQFMGQDKALLESTFKAWASDKQARLKKEKNMQKGARMIANSGKALQAEIFTTWNAETEVTRKKKRSKDQSTQRALRMISGSEAALKAQIFNVIVEWVQKIKKGRKATEAGTAKAMRMMASSDKALSNLCFDSWAKILGEKKKKEEGNKKAMRMISGSGQLLLTECFKNWAKMFVTKKAKEQNTAKAVRMIAASGEALQAACHQSWAQYITKSRDKNKKLRAMEATLGASARGLQLLVMTAWHNTTILQARKNRSKGRTMGAAMKSISSNQELLIVQMYCGWARAGKREKVDKLQEESNVAQAALDEAMALAQKAVDEDLGRVNQEIERLRAEKAAVDEQLAEAKKKAEEYEAQTEQVGYDIQERDSQLSTLTSELEDSRSKAKDIGEELAKVGIYLQNAGSKKTRPRSGTKSGDVPTLPKIGGRPSSGRSGKAPVPPGKSAWNEEGQL